MCCLYLDACGRRNWRRDAPPRLSHGRRPVQQHLLLACSTPSSVHSSSAHTLVKWWFLLPLAVASAATLTEVAGIITTLAKDHLGSLMVHPGHATVGVYYLAKRHEVR